LSAHPSERWVRGHKTPDCRPSARCRARLGKPRVRSRPDGNGDNTIVAFSDDRTRSVRLVEDPELSPLDLIVAPNGNLLVASEHPFGAPDAVTTVREYDPEAGRLVRVFSASRLAAFRRPRGLRLGADGYLYCVAQDEVVAFDVTSGRCLGAIVRLARLFGQALAFFPP
jgi:hypothetical protein